MRQKEVNRGCCWTAPPTVGWGVVDDDDAAAPTNSLPSVRLTSLCATAAENIVLYSLHPSFHPSFLRCEVGEKKKVRQAEEDNGGKRGREEKGRGGCPRESLWVNVLPVFYAMKEKCFWLLGGSRKEATTTTTFLRTDFEASASIG